MGVASVPHIVFVRFPPREFRCTSFVFTAVDIPYVNAATVLVRSLSMGIRCFHFPSVRKRCRACPCPCPGGHTKVAPWGPLLGRRARPGHRRSELCMAVSLPTYVRVTASPERVPSAPHPPSLGTVCLFSLMYPGELFHFEFCNLI